MKSRLATLWRTHRAAVLILYALAVAALIGAFIWPITDLIAAHDVGTITGALQAPHLQTAREAVRTQLLTLGAGLFAFWALVYTARNFTLSRRNVQLTEQGQVTDRYTKAIEQLGSPDKLDARIGAVYALERIARDSAIDHPTVMEVLSAFIREHSHEQWPPPAADESATRPVPQTRPDVQAAITVIGRRDTQRDRYCVDLTDANLPLADLTGANLSDADLTGADLTSAKLPLAKLPLANLTSADLSEANLTGTSLSKANLIDAKLTRADLTGADLTFADLTFANLTRAKLTGADLTGADLTGAHLNGADLNGADLTRAKLTDADLTSARWSPDAVVPAGWRRDTRRGSLGRLKRTDTNPGDAAPGPAPGT